MGFIFLLIPIYGYFALTTHWEMYFVSIIFGMSLGVVNAFSRSLFSDFIPHGRESQFFGFYEITDRGTSWLGKSIVKCYEATCYQSCS
jgi:UMF1 family MFS transporter